MSDSEQLRKKKSQQLEANLASLRLFGAQVREKVNSTPGSSKRSERSKFEIPEAFVYSPAEFTERTPKPGAYPSSIVGAASFTSPGPRKLPPTEILTSTGNKYKVFILSSDDTSNKLCFSIKGGGETFCTNTNCSIALHKTKPKFNALKGDVFIEKTTGAVFSKAYLNSGDLSPELIGSWIAASYSFEEWIYFFRLATLKIKDESQGTKKIDFKDLQQA